MLRKFAGGVLATAFAAAIAAVPAGAMTVAKPSTSPSTSVTLARHMGPGIGAMGPHVGHMGPIHSGPFFGHHHRHFRNFGFVVGVPYYDYYGGYGNCGWLHHRAVVTGSRYWWNRYYDCVGYY